MHPLAEPDEASLPPRYAPERPLPAYRYVPGFHPHPTADPEGHSFGADEPDIEFVPPEAWRRSAEYLFGVDLFNRRYYWEAHEAWELVWHTCDKARTQGLFVQGLIQIAAALLKWHMGSEAGARKLYDNGMARLEPARRGFPAGYMGIALEAFARDVEVCFERLLATPDDPAPRLPVIALQVAAP